MMDNMRIHGRDKRLRVGFIIQETTGAGGFQELVWRSMVDASRQRDVNAFIFAGGSLESSPWNQYEKSLNLVYDLIDREFLDGLIVCTPVGNYVAVERFQQFCRSFRLPLVMIVGALEGFPGVCADNRSGLRDAILHLIEVHRVKKIAFIKGTEGNQDAEERFAVFTETMREAGLPIDPGLVFNGIFNEDSGAEAVHYFVHKMKKSFDAIVAANDAMAIGAVNGLRKDGIEVPWDVLVTGFDDTIEARGSIPSLTTVKQPLDDMCRAALDMLARLIKGEQVTDTTVIPTRLVIRESCGCSSALVREVMEQEAPVEIKTAPLLNHKESNPADVLAKVLNDHGAVEDEQQTARIISAFLDDLAGGKEPVFIPVLRRTLQDAVIRGRAIPCWQHALADIRRSVRRLWADRETAAAAERILFEAMVLAGEMAQGAVERRLIDNDKKAKILTTAGQMLITTFNFEMLKEVVKTQLSLLGLPSCFISVLHDISSSSYESELFAAYTKDGALPPLLHAAHRLPEPAFFPVDRRFTCAVHPLCIREKRLGYALFELGPEDGLLYNTLQVQIASAVMGSELIRERERAEAEERKRSGAIEELIRPMIRSIEEVTSTARKKIGIIGDLLSVTKENGEKLESTNSAIKLMNEKIAKMSDIVNVIDDISSRVNIMAINTSIESAHAGEFGRGFAVIAAEIRKLADSIKEHATVIANSLNDLKPMIEASKKAGDSSREAFMKLERDVTDVAETLKQITGSMDELSRASAAILSLMNIV